MTMICVSNWSNHFAHVEKQLLFHNSYELGLLSTWEPSWEPCCSHVFQVSQRSGKRFDLDVNASKKCVRRHVICSAMWWDERSLMHFWKAYIFLEIVLHRAMRIFFFMLQGLVALWRGGSRVEESSSRVEESSQSSQSRSRVESSESINHLARQCASSMTTGARIILEGVRFQSWLENLIETNHRDQ